MGKNAQETGSTGSMVEVMTARAKALQKQFMYERRLLFLCTVLVGIAVLLWIISITTDFWFIVDGGPGIYVNHTGRYFLYSNSGLWRICRRAYGNSTTVRLQKGVTTTSTSTIAPLDSAVETQELLNTTTPNVRHVLYRKCKMHDVFPNEAKIRSDPTLDENILQYTRTEIMFSIITLIVMLMGFFFSIYTFRNPRYTFKRLAGCIHFITCLSVMVVIEVLINSITYEKENLHVVHPRGASYYYGFSYVLAWIVFAMNLIAGISFLWYSKKRKGNKAPNDEIAMADEPTIIGR